LGKGFPTYIYVEAPNRQTYGPSQFQYKFHGADLHLGAQAALCSGVNNEYAMDSLLRILLSLKLLPESGFLLHAATVVREGHSFVFMGRSGAGKSTVARHSPAGTVLTDEISLLRKINGVWHACGTPFWGEFRAGGQNRVFPLAGIHALVQAPANQFEPLDPRAALRELLGNVLFFSAEPRHREPLLKATSEIAGAVPFYRLRFTRDISFWGEMAA
jgi:hypothetical protein